MKTSLSKFFLRAVSAMLALIVCMSLFGCAPSKSEYRDFNYFAMDTYITLRLAYAQKDGTRLSDEYLNDVAAECERIVGEVDLAVSCHNPSSEVYALNSSINKLLSANELLVSVISTANNIHKLTGGVFDYSLGTLTELWNVNDGGPVPSPAEISEALTHSGTEKFLISGASITKLDTEAKLDLGGIGKGAAAQRLLEYLSTTDVEYGIVSIGGNIGVYGEKPNYGTYKIGLRDPDDKNSVLGHFYLGGGFVSVSGDYERYFEEDGVRYHHIIDPRTGYPARSGLRSVAVHATNGALSDALSTALFILGVEKSMALYENSTLDFEAVFVTDSGEIIATPGLEGSFVIAEK